MKMNYFEKFDFIFGRMKRSLEKSKLMQYIYLLYLYSSIFILSHDLYFYKANNVSVFSLLSKLIIIKTFFPNSPSSDWLDIFLILFIIFLSLLVFLSFKLDILRKSKKYKCEAFKILCKIINIALLFILIMFNGIIYEICFSLFICKTNLESPGSSCYSNIRYLTIFLGSLLMILITFINYIFNLSFYLPWHFGKSVYPTQYRSRYTFELFMAVLHGYQAIETEIPTDIAIIIRISFRVVFLIYCTIYAIGSNKLIYSSKMGLNFFIFLKAFNFFSILIEFCIIMTEISKSITYVKIIVQVILSLITIHVTNMRERKFIKDSPVYFRNNNENNYNLFSKYLYYIQNYKKVDDENLHLIFQKMLSNIEEGNNESYEKVVRDTKKFFKRAKIKDESYKYKAYSLIKFYITKLKNTFNDKIFECSKEDPYYLQYILLYSSLCIHLTHDYFSAGFFVEKIALSRSFRKDFLSQLYVKELKNSIIENYKLTDNEKINMKTFYDNVKYFSEFTSTLENSLSDLKKVFLNLESGKFKFEQFLQELRKLCNDIKQATKNYRQVHNLLCESKDYQESVGLMIVNKIFDEVFYKENDIYLKELKFSDMEHLLKNFHTNYRETLYTISFFDKNEDLKIKSVSKNLIIKLKYTKEMLIDADLRMILPEEVARHHKEITNNFVNSRSDFFKREVYFITSEGYALLLAMTCLIFPDLENNLIFFNVFEDLNVAPVLNESINVTRNCYVVVNSINEIITINKEFEQIFGISNKIIKSIKPSFFNSLVKVNADKAFSKNKNTFYTEMPFPQFFMNLKLLNYNNLKESYLEDYVSHMKFLNTTNLKKYFHIIIKLNMIKRVFGEDDRYDPFFFFIKLTVELKDNIYAKYLHDTIKKEKRSKSPIAKLAGKAKFSNVVLSLFINSLDVLNLKSNTLERKLTDFEKNKINEDGSADNTFVSVDKKKENNYDKVKQYKEVFNMTPRVLILFVITFVYIFFYIYSIYYFCKFNDDSEISFYLLEDILSIKNTLLIFYLSTLNSFLTQNKITNINANFTENEKTLQSFCKDSFNEYLYNLNIYLLKLDNKYGAAITQVLDTEKVKFRTISYNFDLHNEDFSALEIISRLRTKIDYISNFHNLSFNIYPDQFNSDISNTVFDINKHYLNNSLKTATEGDISVYFLMNNLIDKLLPLYENSIEHLLDNTYYMTDAILFKELILHILLWLLVVLNFFLIFFFFFKTSSDIMYQHFYFIFNMIKVFNALMVKKINCLETLITELNLNNYSKLKGINSEFEVKNSKGTISSVKDANSSKEDEEKEIKKMYRVGNLMSGGGTVCTKRSNLGLLSSTSANSFSARKLGKNDSANKSLNNLLVKDLQVATNSSNNNVNEITTKTNSSLIPKKTEGNKINSTNSFITDMNNTSANLNQLLDARSIREVLLERPSKITFIGLLFLVIFLLFLLHNSLSFILTKTYSSNLASRLTHINNFYNINNFPFEVSLIYIVSLSRRKEIFYPSDNNYKKSINLPIFTQKINSFNDLKNFLKIELNGGDRALNNLYEYQRRITGEDVCNGITQTYQNIVFNQTGFDCTYFNSSIFKNGLYFGYDALSNYLNDNYNEIISSGFDQKSVSKGLEVREIIEIAHDKILLANLENIKKLIDLDMEENTKELFLYFNFLIYIFCVLLVGLIFSYICIYLDVREKCIIISETEILLMNLMKF